MQVIEEFLRLRREGKGEEAYQLLAPGASFGCPWGGMHHGKRIRELLTDERNFVRKGYLNSVPIEKIAEGTFQRKFKWNRGMEEHGNYGLEFFFLMPLWREIYFVENGKIKLVTADKFLKCHSIFHILGFT
ncbi:unnamed protein product [Phytomonas sp. Hart1]|nr:unnamed protein product [Phytomonas sp. Hart1]|eukprot:CCW68788.1 unnamed protein product [Phytomonas sp. isolate Hart1]